MGPFAGRGFGGGYDEATADDAVLGFDVYVVLLASEDVAVHSSFWWYDSCSTFPWYSCKFLHRPSQPYYKHSPTCIIYSPVQGHLGVVNIEPGILIINDASIIPWYLCDL